MIGICILLSHEGIEVLTPVVLVITCMGLKAGQAAIMVRERRERERGGRERERESERENNIEGRMERRDEEIRV